MVGGCCSVGAVFKDGEGMMKVIIVLSLWIVCGIINAGFTNAYFARKYDLCNGRSELSFSIGLGLISGPVGLIVVPILSGFGEYGWSLYVLNNPSCKSKTKTFKY